MESPLAEMLFSARVLSVCAHRWIQQNDLDSFVDYTAEYMVDAAKDTEFRLNLVVKPVFLLVCVCVCVCVGWCVGEGPLKVFHISISSYVLCLGLYVPEYIIVLMHHD